MMINDATNMADYIVYANVGSPTLRLDTIVGGKLATVRISQQPSAAIAAQVTIASQVEITGSQGDGVLIDPGLGGVAPTVTIKDTSIHDNMNDGVHVSSELATVTVGENPAVCTALPAIQPCSIFCNGRYGIEVDSGGQPNGVDAATDFWDHAVPTSGAAPADLNLTGFVRDGCPSGAASGACMQ
jgi:hypothetical protein